MRRGVQLSILPEGEGSSINGNGGKNGGNDSYTITGRGEVSRKTLVREVKEGKHPDTHIFL